jgi:methionine-R-sulfoxide reductase
MVLVRVYNEQGQLSEPVEMPKVELTREQWKERLTPAQFKILRASGTEAAFCGGLLHNKGEGVYVCAGCGLPLFQANTKFESGTGWPSFFQPLAKENIDEIKDFTYGMTRTEIRCARCGGHLGHVFNDGPRPTGLRYCTNSDALRFVPQDQLKTLAEKIPVATTQPDAHNGA